MKKDNLNQELGIKNQEDQSLFERLWEKALWSTRYIVVLAVFFSVLAAISLFILGSYEIYHSILHLNPLTNMGEVYKGEEITGHSLMLLELITAIDLYLIGVVLLIFGFGIYELFISKIDIARADKGITILEIENLDELKNKIIKVIIMVLIVSFFERILKISQSYNDPIEMLYFAISVFALSLGVYFMKKHS